MKNNNGYKVLWEQGEWEASALPIFVDQSIQAHFQTPFEDCSRAPFRPSTLLQDNREGKEGQKFPTSLEQNHQDFV